MNSPIRYRSSSRHLSVAGLLLVFSALSCGREPTGPSGVGGLQLSQGLAFQTRFPDGYEDLRREAQSVPNGAGSLVTFTRVRATLRDPNNNDAIVLQTVTDFPASATEVPLTLNVPLPATAPATGMPLRLTLEYLNASDAVVFIGGPVGVTAVPVVQGQPAPAPAQITIPVSYTGPGATATGIRFTTAPSVVNTGQSFTFVAEAFDGTGRAITGAPILYNSLNPSIASINAASGAGTAGPSRGSVSIEAKLLTGPAVVAQISIISPPATLAEVRGTGQTAPIGTALATPIEVRVIATDGGPAPGVAVTFAPQNGGSVGNATIMTDETGLAATTWRLGSFVGAQQLTASAAGLSGSPITFRATGLAIIPVRLVFGQQPPSSAAAGSALAPAVTVRAVDADRATTTAFTGEIRLALGSNANGATLNGSPIKANAVEGVATFTNLSVNTLGTYTLVAQADDLAEATSNAFSVGAGTATKLAFRKYPVLTGSTAGRELEQVSVEVLDALGNLVTTSNASVVLTANGPTAVAAGTENLPPGVARVAPATGTSANTLSELATRDAVGGIATFSRVQITRAGAFTLTASSTGLTTATGAQFAVGAGPASTLKLVSGDKQEAPGGITLGKPIIARVTDDFDNGVNGVTVNFAPGAGHGSVNPTSAITAGDGSTQTLWTLSGTAGAKTLNVTSPSLAGQTLQVPATATTTTTSGIPHTWTGATSTSWTVTTNWSPATVPSGADPVTIPTGTPNAPSISAPASIGNLTIASGAQVTNTSTLTVSGSLEASGYNVIIGGGTLTLNGASGTIAGGITGNVTVSTGAYSASAFTEVIGNLTIASNGTLEVGAQEVKVYSDLATTTGGRLKMTGNGYAIVMGNASFTGGSESGLLTAGTLYLEGNFTASGTAYTASGTHVTRFDGNHVGPGTQTITYSPSAGSGFNHAIFASADAKVLAGAPVFLGNVDLQGSVYPAPPPGLVTGSVTARIGGNFSDATDYVEDVYGGWQVATTNFFGTNKSINSGFITSNVTVSGTLSLITLPPPLLDGGSSLRASVRDSYYVQINGDLTVSGSGAILKLNGSELDVTGNFATASGGALDMTNAEDGFWVYGSAVFGGGSTVGKLTLGSLYVLQDFTQSGATNSFAPSVDFYTEIGEYYLQGVRAAQSRSARPLTGSAAQAAHDSRERTLAPLRAQRAERRARLDRRAAAYARRGIAAPPPRGQVARTTTGRGASGARLIQTANVYSGTSNISFANTTTSFFGTLYLAGPQTNLLSNITVAGSFETGFSLTHTVASATPRTITSTGADVRSVEFSNVRWVLLDGSRVWALDYVTFSNMDPAVDQFTLSRTSDELAMCDCSTSYELYYWTFNTAPTTGHYMNVTDTNGGPNFVELYMSGLNQQPHGGRVITAGGATVTNWPAVAQLFTWTGATSNSWNLPTNWSGGVVPTSIDDVVIPAAPANEPVLYATSFAHNLTIEAGATISTYCQNLFIYGNVVAPAIGATVTYSCDGEPVYLVGDGSAFNTVVGHFDLVEITGNYRVSGPGNKLVASSTIRVGSGGNLTINGGRVDVGGSGGWDYGSFETVGSGTLTMTNANDELFVGRNGAWFTGGSTAGLLTAGTITIPNAGLQTTSSSTSPSAFAPSGTHTVVLGNGTGAGLGGFQFYDPASSFFQNVVINGNAAMSVAADLTIKGTLSRGIGASVATVQGAGRVVTVGSLNISGNPTTFDGAAIKLAATGPAPTFNNVTFQGFTGFTGPLLDIQRTSGGPFTFNALDFSAVTGLGTGGIFLRNSGSQTVNIRGSNPGTGTLNVHFQNIGGGTLSWVP